MTIQDYQIDAGKYGTSAVTGMNCTLTRMNGTGGQFTVTCDDNCTIEYSCYSHSDGTSLSPSQ